MKKKVIGIFLAVACTACFAAGLTACKNDGGNQGGGGKPPQDQTEHRHVYAENVVAPQCAAEGYTEYRCSCGANYVGDYTKALGHDMAGDTCTRCSAHPTEGLTYASVSGGYAVTGIGTATSTDVIIPSAYSGSPVVAIGAKAFSEKKKIEYVTFSPSVKTVGEEAFYGCESLKRIDLGAVEELGAHSLCAKNLTEIELPETLKTIGLGVFAFLKMETIHIPASVENIAPYAFSGCDFESITVDAANTRYSAVDNCVIGSVTDEGGTRNVILFGCKNSCIPASVEVSEIYDSAFSGVVGLTELVIPDCIETLGNRVFADSDMTSLKIGKGLKKVGYGVFHNCENLASITVDAENETFTAAGNCLINKARKAVVLGCKTSVIPSDPEVVTEIAGNAFRECALPEGFSIPSNVTKIGGYAFADSGLKSITVRGNLTDANSAFASCTTLKNVIFEEGVTAISKGMFANTGVERITLPESLTTIGERAFNASSLTGIDIPSKVTAIPSGAFDSCNALLQVVIPDTVTEIGDTAFSNCTNLVKVTLGRNVTAIGNNAFLNDHKLTELINLSGLDIQKSTTKDGTVFGGIGYSVATTKFQRANLDCYFAGEIYTDTNYTSKLDIVDGFAFYNNDGAWELYSCGRVGDVTLPTNYKGGNYDVASGAFALYTPASGVTITSGVNKLKSYSFFYNRSTRRVKAAGVKDVEFYVFQQCGYLESLTFRDCGTLAGYAITYCDTIEEINLHNVTTVSQCAFLPGTAYNSGESATLAKITVTGDTTLEGYALCNYTNRDAVVILAKEIKSIASYGFYNCKFDTVYFTGTSEEWSDMSIGYAEEGFEDYDALNTVAVYCYSETAPTGEGNYWHYAPDGTTPVKW